MRDIKSEKRKKEIGCEKWLWWWWITMTTPAVSQVFYVLLLSAGSRQMTKAVPSLLRYLQYWNYHHFPQGLCTAGQLLSHCWKLHTEAVNRLDIDRCDWKLLLFEKKHVPAQKNPQQQYMDYRTWCSMVMK